MRTIVLAVSLCGSSLLRICGSSDDAAQPKTQASAEANAAGKASASAEAKAALVPSIGGSIVSIGAYNVEIAVYQNGVVEGQVKLANGMPIADPASAKLAATVNGNASARERVQLDWSPVRQRFAGSARVQKELASGPIDVELTISGKADKATLAQTAVLVGPEYGGAVLAASEFGVELAAKPSGEVEAHVRDAAGATLEGGADVKLKAKLQAAGGHAQEIALEWDKARAAFLGRAEAGAQLVPGPVQINVTTAGALRVGGLAQLALTGLAVHGGRVVVAGDYSVELVAKDGLVAAYVMDAAGKAHVEGNLDLKLLLGADADASARLKWDAPSASYKAKLAAALDLAVQPIRVQIDFAGRSHIGGYGRLNANANAKLHASADLNAAAKAAADAKADAKLRVKPPTINAKAGLQKSAGAQAKVNVAAPKVNVTPPKVSAQVKKGASAGGSAKAGFSFGTK